MFAGKHSWGNTKPFAVEPFRRRPFSRAPVDSILHYDADIDAFSEQTGGAHTFNHAVLSPQYQRNADGSYANVGAKPAVDVFDGEKWLRSCGAVQNIATVLPSDSTFGISGAVTRAVVSDGLRFVITGSAACMRAFTVTASTTYTLSWWVKNNGGTSYKQRIFNVTAGSNIVATTNYFSSINSNDFTRVDITFTTPAGCTSIYVYAAVGETGDSSDFIIKDMVLLTATAYPVPYVPPGATQPASNATPTNGCWFSLPDGSPLWQALDGQADGVELVVNGDFSDGLTGWTSSAAIVSNDSVILTNNTANVSQPIDGAKGRTWEIKYHIKSKTYTGVLFIDEAWAGYMTIPNTIGAHLVRVTLASTANRITLKLGGGPTYFGDLAIDNISIQRIQPQPLTLATRIRMGVLYNEVYVANHSIIDPSESTWLQRFGDGNYAYIVRAYDGKTSVSTPILNWPRNSIILRVTQVNTAGTEFRVGHMIGGTHTTIQWGAWKTFDGSFNPSTLYRLMLGYLNAYPLWFSRITAWKKQVTDAEILEAMA